MKSPTYFTTHASPLGELTLAATDDGLCDLYFKGHTPAPKCEGWKRDNGPRFDAARAWLDAYFAGENPRKMPTHIIVSGTEFQRRVWDTLRAIPRGKTKTYAELATAIGLPKAVRAVGTAVGQNPLSILIPCHRVIGRDGSLTGYAGGLTRKKHLLALEGLKID
jgi:methylated-DNA-[protein]-cysteine S-methyltransferase